MSVTNEIGCRIKQLRTEQGMSQEELGAILGVSKSAIQKYEAGKITDLRADKIRMLCDTFGVCPRFFVFEEEHSLKPYFQKQKLRELPALLPSINQWEDILDQKDADIAKLVTHISQLNSVGFRKLQEYAHDLVRLEEYKAIH